MNGSAAAGVGIGGVVYGVSAYPASEEWRHLEYCHDLDHFEYNAAQVKEALT